MGRIGRSFHLVGESYRILMQDKELMVLPLMSGTIIAGSLAGIFFGSGLTGSAVEQRGPALYVPLFLMYVAAYAVSIFFQAAVVAGATERMRGGDPTVSSALGAAARRIGPILMWAIVAATVGMIIKVIHDRVGFVGRIVARIVGAAWSLATVFVVPVLVLEDRSVGDSFTRSVGIFKKMWGETFVGGTTLGAAAACAWVTLIALVGMLSWLGAGLFAVVVFGVGAVGLMAFFTALDGIYTASLFQYATGQQASLGLDNELLKNAFVPKTR